MTTYPFAGIYNESNPTLTPLPASAPPPLVKLLRTPPLAKLDRATAHQSHSLTPLVNSVVLAPINIVAVPQEPPKLIPLNLPSLILASTPPILQPIVRTPKLEPLKRAVAPSSPTPATVSSPVVLNSVAVPPVASEELPTQYVYVVMLRTPSETRQGDQTRIIRILTETEVAHLEGPSDESKFQNWLEQRYFGIRIGPLAELRNSGTACVTWSSGTSHVKGMNVSKLGGSRFASYCVFKMALGDNVPEVDVDFA